MIIKVESHYNQKLGKLIKELLTYAKSLSPVEKEMPAIEEGRAKDLGKEQ